jgi:hypothetical protein
MRSEKMRSDEVVNCALATLLFCFNNRYAFFRNPGVRDAYRSMELFPVDAKTEDEFAVLTNNALLAALQSHVIALNEAVKAYCLDTGRPRFGSDPLFDHIRYFVSVMRNAKSHMGKKLFIFTWERTFQFDCWIPLEKVASGSYRYKYDSQLKRRISFKGSKDRELRITPGYIYRLIIFSFHLRHILSLRTKSACDQYLAVFKSKFVEK